MTPNVMSATSLKGEVRENGPAGQPMSGVVVSAFGATSFSTTNTGKFVLVFSKRHPGDLVTLSLAKDGMEVVNDLDLEMPLRSEPDENPAMLFMCEKGNRNVHAAHYYRVEIERKIENSFSEELLVIKDKYRQDIEKKNAEIAKLPQEKEKAISFAEEMAEKFAEVRTDQASELFKKAYRHFQEGEIDKAIEVLDDAKMEEARRKAKEALEKSVEAYMLKARLIVMKLRFDEAETYYRKAVQDMPGNAYNVFEFAVFLSKQNKHFMALKFYKDALNLCEKIKK